MRLARALMLIGLTRAALNGGTRPFAAPLRRSARRLSTLAQTAVSPAPYGEDALAEYAPARPGDSRRLSAENGLPSNGPNGVAPPAIAPGLLAELDAPPVAPPPPSPPPSVAEIESFLCSGAVRGIGPKRAALLVRKFGERTLDVLRSGTELLEVPGIGPKTLDGIREALAQHDASAMRGEVRTPP